MDENSWFFLAIASKQAPRRVVDSSNFRLLSFHYIEMEVSQCYLQVRIVFIFTWPVGVCMFSIILVTEFTIDVSWRYWEHLSSTYQTGPSSTWYVAFVYHKM